MKAKEIIPASKPRNFVAKNQKTGGAGAHRDKKKEQKQGYEKHKGQGVEEGWKEKMAAAALAGGMAFGASAGQKVNPGTDQITAKPAVTQQADANDPFTVDGKQMPKHLRSMLAKMSDKDGEQAYMAWRALANDASSNQIRMMAGQLLDKITAKYQKESVEEGVFGIDSKTKGAIQNIVSQLSDIPGMWDHSAQTFTDAGMEKLKSLLKDNPKYIKYAVNLTADDYDESIEMERVRDPEDWDEGNTEPPNNFAVYINGKKWKVFQGRGQYADDAKEMKQYYDLKAWAQKKSQETGKKWEVARTGERPTA